MTTATKKRKPSRSRKPSAEMKTVECAFCGGSGTDPFELLSKLSRCPVCEGRKVVQVDCPTVGCAYCHGTGKQPHTRLTCSACKGTGLITLAGPTAQCPQCDGTGRTLESDLSCTLCRGTGLIAKKPNAAKQTNRSASKGQAASKT